MLLGNKEKTIRLYAENFLQGHITFDYGTMDDERLGLSKASFELSKRLLDWLKADEKNDESKDHKLETHNVYRQILSWRIRGRIKGQIIDVDLESKIEDLVREKTQLEDEVKDKKNDVLKALTQLKDQDRQIALMEAQVFYLKQGGSDGS